MENAPGGGQGAGVSANHRALGEGARREAQHVSLEWTKGPLALPCGAAR